MHKNRKSTTEKKVVLFVCLNEMESEFQKKDQNFKKCKKFQTYSKKRKNK